MACPSSHFVVLDFEATCFENANPNKKARRCEIIEFPMVVMARVSRKATNASNASEIEDDLEVVGVFHEYVRPEIDGVLSPFCTRLTGITQDTVNSADTFPAVFKRAQIFLVEHGVTADNGVIVTVGNWDLEHMLPTQVGLSAIRGQMDTKIPRIFRRWINVKNVYKKLAAQKAFGNDDGDRSLEGMLRGAGLVFEGRPHSGIDDTHNTARLLRACVHKGWSAASFESDDISSA